MPKLLRQPSRLAVQLPLQLPSLLVALLLLAELAAVPFLLRQHGGLLLLLLAQRVLQRLHKGGTGTGVLVSSRVIAWGSDQTCGVWQGWMGSTLKSGSRPLMLTHNR